MSKCQSDSAKGFRIEKLVASACEILCVKREIMDYLHAQPGRQLDAEGIDILVQLNNGLFFGIQCKANLSQVASHFKKHPNISYILVIGPFSRKKVLSWRVANNVNFDGIQVVNTRSEIRTSLENYDKILASTVIKVRNLVSLAIKDSRHI